MVIWALFDDANRCYYHSLKDEPGVEIYSIGINNLNEDNYYKIDLSILNPNLISELSKLPHPDVILASPPCESWSGADCSGRMFKSIDDKGNWVVRNSSYYDEYNTFSHPVRKRFFIRKEISRLVGETTIAGTIKIIQHFNPKIWVIENPQTSMIWDFLENHWNFKMNMNLATYSSYDENFSLKPTNFASNVILFLKKFRNKGNTNHMNSNYAKRSDIPKDLVLDIYKQIRIYNAIERFIR